MTIASGFLSLFALSLAHITPMASFLEGKRTFNFAILNVRKQVE